VIILSMLVIVCAITIAIGYLLVFCGSMIYYVFTDGSAPYNVRVLLGTSSFLACLLSSAIWYTLVFVIYPIVRQSC
jgi:hypothetical protein